MNIEELKELIENEIPGAPRFEVSTTTGQIVIYTGLCADDDGELMEMDQQTY
jgi:hypothetical protein